MHARDFPDRISPMLVKELRQGLRTRSFIGVFLALQIILGVILLSAGAAATSDDAGSTISNIIFIFFSIAVLVVQPMRGISTLSSEIKGNTIDMMVLTRLSAWRIVTGKWFAIVSQSALMLTTIIPYLILRYFFGGMNLFGEIVLLAMIFVASATLTAITVGLSASGSVILRSILPMFALPIGAYTLLMLAMFGMRGGNGIADFCALDTTESRIIISIIIMTCVYYGFFFLAAGTSLIAPYADNHSTIRRLIALLVTIVTVVLCCEYVTDEDALPFFLAMVLAPPFAVSLTEFGTLVPPTYQKFSRFGFAGKVAAFFFAPGWSSGVFFCGLLTAISTIPYFFITSSWGGDDHVIIGLGILGTLLFPALIINVFRMKGPSRVSNYVLLGVSSGILALVLLGVAESMSNPNFLWLFVWIPPVALSMLETRISEDLVYAAIVIVDAVLVVALLVLALRHHRSSITNVEKEQSSPT
ncbi:MAG: ABC transporter permease [Akkermansiaceae bacterium]